jgi:uncharacterized C2H2 Zn-finger protein
MPFICKHCEGGVTFGNHTQALVHYSIKHRSGQILLECPLVDCHFSVRKKYKAFEEHVTCFHGPASKVNAPPDQPTELYACPRCHEGHEEKCMVINCMYEGLKLIQKGECKMEHIMCPYGQCVSAFLMPRHFKRHINKYHPVPSVLDDIPLLRPNQDNGQVQNDTLMMPDVAEPYLFDDATAFADATPQEVGDGVAEYTEDDLKKKIVDLILWLKLDARVPDTKIPELMNNLIELENIALSLCKPVAVAHLATCRREKRLPAAFREDATEKELTVVAHDLARRFTKKAGIFNNFCRKGKELGSVHLVKKFAKRSLPYVNPVNSLEGLRVTDEADEDTPFKDDFRPAGMSWCDTLTYRPS